MIPSVTHAGTLDVEQAYRHIEQLCYPRRVGTPGERSAAQYVVAEFTKLGLCVRRDPFPVSFFPSEVANRLVFCGCIFLVVLGSFLSVQHPLLAAVCWAMAGVLINMPWALSSHVGDIWPTQANSENVVAKLKGIPPAPARVIFMAHYDTKSQLFSTGIRVVLVTTGRIVCYALALIGLLGAIGFALSVAVAHLLALAALIALTCLLGNLSDSRSPGALDNGSGVGLLLELARSWRPRPETPLDVVWVATGSEEVGLDGARHFLSLYDYWWQEKPTLLINLESVAFGTGVYLAGEANALKLAERVLKDMHVPHKRLHVVGAGMDHEPFAVQGLPALSILGDVVRAAFLFHSPRDNMSAIDRNSLLRAGEIAVRIADTWADRHAPADLAKGPPM